jgi:DNA oxidative demethylase
MEPGFGGHRALDQRILIMIAASNHDQGTPAYLFSVTQHLARDGFRYVPGYLSPGEQVALRDEVLGVIAAAPLHHLEIPGSGRRMSVAMTNAGPLGWHSDKDGGYRYEPANPFTGASWPAIPKPMLKAWADLADYPAPPEACLVNYYGPEARMGLHRDFDEKDLRAPVVSISLGDAALFRLGGASRKGPTRTLKLNSGDAVVLGGAARLFFHGVDRIYGGSSHLLPQGGRYNLTLRRVTALA